MVKIYYNDNDEFICDWLEELIKDGLIGAGVVDRRPIQEIEANDLKEFTRCHFFAGVGGWELALNLAGWGDGPVWSGSCPCQPFSVPGKRKGFADKRHLWPDWFRLINECRPPTIFGEQVASPLGRAWLNTVRSNLETLGYAVGAADLCAASVGAPHIRQRLWFVADDFKSRLEGHSGDGDKSNESGWDGKKASGSVGESSSISGMADTDERRFGQLNKKEWSIHQLDSHCITSWANAVTIPCRDGKSRPIPTERRLFPMVNVGVTRNRVGILRGAGNMIVPELAATFIQAFMDTEN